MWHRLDADGSGGLDYGEFKRGIRNLPGTGKIHMTMDDFDIISGKCIYIKNKYVYLPFLPWQDPYDNG
jgi:hypothetical protein